MTIQRYKNILVYKIYCIFCYKYFKILYPKSDSNRHDLRHKFLKLECLPFHHRGIYHIRQAFYFQHREIVSNLAHLTTVWVPEDMIIFLFCRPTWTRTTNISLEVRSYIPLTMGPNFPT